MRPKLKTNQSEKSKKREQKRNSPETHDFRAKIVSFLKAVDADDETAYSIKRDLSVMTHMEFYGQHIHRLKVKSYPIEMAIKYVELLNKYNDQKFAEKLLRKLCVQQNQTFRKLAKRSATEKRKAERIGKSNGIWEHVIPIKVIMDEIVTMLRSSDLAELRKLLELYSRAGQRFLTKDQNSKLCKQYNASMPARWNWKDEKCDLMARYMEAGIVLEENEPKS